MKLLSMGGRSQKGFELSGFFFKVFSLLLNVFFGLSVFASSVFSVLIWFSCFHLFCFVSFTDHTAIGKRVLS